MVSQPTARTGPVPRRGHPAPVVRCASRLVLLLGVALPGLAAQAPPTAELPPVFMSLEGTWEGEGVLLGRPAVFEMAWELGPSGFVQLSFSNAWVEDGGSSVPVLSARATYLVRGASATGVWIDNRPQRLTLDAVVTDSSVVTHWSAEAEDGRTEYVARSPTSLWVRDFVMSDGEERLFAEATYERRARQPGR